jgi:hypothetical protein
MAIRTVIPATRGRSLLALFLALFAFLALAKLGHAAPAAAGGWQEVHLGGVDVRVNVGRDGRADIVHKIVYRVVAGTLRAVELDGFDADLDLDPAGTVTGEDGSKLALFVARDDKGVVHATVDDTKGLKRGTYTFELRYKVVFAKARLLLDGAFLHMKLRTPAMREGIDGMRVVFDLPSAPTEPQLASGAGVDDGVLVTLRRSAERDELELVRPHVARGELVEWGARVDRKALPAVDDPALHPAPSPVAVHDDSERWTHWGIAALVGLLFAALVAKKGALVCERARLQEAEVRGLVPSSPMLRAVGAGLAMAAAVRMELLAEHLLGAVWIGVTMLLSAVRVVAPSESARATGPWLPLKAEDVFLAQASNADTLDAGTRRGRVVLFSIAALFALAAPLLARVGTDVPYFVALDLVALVPIFFTGLGTQLPPDVARAASLLARPFAHLGRTMKVAPYGHVPCGAADPDEVRILALPRLAMPGLQGIEVGIAWEKSGTTFVPFYGVLVRVLEGSFAAAKMASHLQGVARPLPGRKPEERVYQLKPRMPYGGAAVELVTELAEQLRDRRVCMADFGGGEKRVPPNVKKAA